MLNIEQDIKRAWLIFYLCGNTSSRLNTLRISSPSNTNNKSGCPIRPPTLAIFPYCLCNEVMTLSRSDIWYCPCCKERKRKLIILINCYCKQNCGSPTHSLLFVQRAHKFSIFLTQIYFNNFKRAAKLHFKYVIKMNNEFKIHVNCWFFLFICCNIQQVTPLLVQFTFNEHNIRNNFIYVMMNKINKYFLSRCSAIYHLNKY